jgi:mono/diheme cytochrome c family protein
MHNQPKFIPMRSSEFFADGSSARLPVPGTVARGHLDADTYFYTGKINGVDGTLLPFTATKAVLERGEERYNIYCTPCHSRVGEGNGMIVQRGYRRAASLHDARLREAPIGHFYDVMTNGWGAMPDYASQIEPQDRWAIAAYIRALQLSQNATLNDVPAEQRASLKTRQQLEAEFAGGALGTNRVSRDVNEQSGGQEIQSARPAVAGQTGHAQGGDSAGTVEPRGRKGEDRGQSSLPQGAWQSGPTQRVPQEGQAKPQGYSKEPK